MNAPPQPDFDLVAATALDRLGSMLRKAGTARAAAWAIASEAIAALDLEDCIVYLLDDSGETLTQVAAYGPKLKAPNVIEHAITLRVGQGVVGDCARSRQTIRIDDTRRDSRYLVDDDARLSELAVPLLHDGQLLGVLDSEHSRLGFYRDRHVRVLEQMAALLSTHLATLRSGPQTGAS